MSLWIGSASVTFYPDCREGPHRQLCDAIPEGPLQSLTRLSWAHGLKVGYGSQADFGRHQLHTFLYRKKARFALTVKLTVWTTLDDAQQLRSQARHCAMKSNFSRGLTIEWA